MIKPIRSLACLAFLLVHSLLFAQQDFSIRIPANSKMNLYSPDEYDSLVSFSGVERLSGVLFAKSFQKKIDDEIEWRVVLGFVPDKMSLDKLPRVLYRGEKFRGDQIIELDFFDKSRLLEVLGKYFGETVRSKVDKEKFDLSRNGFLTLSDYRTGVECNRRYYYAKLVDFEGDGSASHQVNTSKKKIDLVGCF